MRSYATTNRDEGLLSALNAVAAPTPVSAQAVEELQERSWVRVFHEEEPAGKVRIPLTRLGRRELAVWRRNRFGQGNPASGLEWADL